MSAGERIEHLERTVRKLAWTAAASCAVALGALGLVLRGDRDGSDTEALAAEVRATRFIVVDEQGRQRGVYGMEEANGYPVLALRDESGAPRASLSVQRGAGPFSSLVLSAGHAGGTAHADLVVWPDAAEMRLSTSPRTSAAIAVRDDGPELVLGGENGKWFRAPD